MRRGLIGGVELAALAEGEGGGLARRHMGGIEAAVLPAVDLGGELARRPALLVDVGCLDDLLHQAQLVVDAEDGEVGFEADELGVAAQHLGADRVEGAEPGHALGDRADERADPLLHLARRLVGEGDGEDVERPRLRGRDQVGDAGRQHPGLAGAGAGKHEHRALRRLDRLALLGVEAGKIGGRLRPDGGAGARRQRPGLRLGQAVAERRCADRLGAIYG